MKTPIIENRSPVVHIVDDDDAVRDALKRLFSSVGLDNLTYASGDEFINSINEGHVGCLIIDLRMPGLSGLEVQRILQEKDITLPVIIITGHGDVETGVRAMKHGAFDFIQKPFNDQLLLDTVQFAIKKHTNEFTNGQHLQSVTKMFASLSPREHDVLVEILEGEPNKRVADNLKVSEKTIEFHRSNIMKKMAARSLADLIKKALLAIAE